MVLGPDLTTLAPRSIRSAHQHAEPSPPVSSSCLLGRFQERIGLGSASDRPTSTPKPREGLHGRLRRRLLDTGAMPRRYGERRREPLPIGSASLKPQDLKDVRWALGTGGRTAWTVGRKKLRGEWRPTGDGTPDSETRCRCDRHSEQRDVAPVDGWISILAPSLSPTLETRTTTRLSTRGPCGF